MLNPGLYLGNLKEAKVTTIGENKTPALCLLYDVTHQCVNEDWQDITPATRTITMWLTPAAQERTFAQLESMGWNGSFAAPEFSMENVTQAQLACEHEPYKGKLQERWSLYEYNSSMNSLADAPADVIRTLEANYKNAKSAKRKPTGRPAPVKTTVSAPPADDAPDFLREGDKF